MTTNIATSQKTSITSRVIFAVALVVLVTTLGVSAFLFFKNPKKESTAPRSAYAMKTDKPTPFAKGRFVVEIGENVVVLQKQGAATSTSVDAGPYRIESEALATVAREVGVRKVKPLLSPNTKTFSSLAKRLFLFETDPLVDHRTILDRFLGVQDVASVELDKEYKALLVPNDPFYASSNSWGQGYEDLWGLYKVHLTPTSGDTPPGSGQSGWDIERGNDETIIAVSDTGVDYDHEDIQFNLWSTADSPGNGIDDDENGYIDDFWGFDFVNGTYNEDTGYWTDDADGPFDDHYHGTHVAGTLGAVTNNSVGVAGVCWHCRIMAVKGLNSNGAGYLSALIKTIEYATDNGADVINMSWGGSGQSESLDAVLAMAHDAGVTLVAAAGNDGIDTISQHPANSPSVITVGSIAPDDMKSSFSNYGAKIDVVAPGGGHRSDENDLWRNILSAKSSAAAPSELDVAPNYRRLAGTSMAAPHVSGLVGLMKSHTPGLAPETIRNILRQTAQDVNNETLPGWDDQIGHGVIHARDALLLEEPLISNITEPEQSAPIQPGTDVEIRGSAGGPNFSAFSVSVGHHEGGAIVWMEIASGTDPAENATLATWSVAESVFGERLLKLTVVDTDGHQLHDVLTVAVGVHEGWPKYAVRPTSPGIGDLDPTVPGKDILFNGSEEVGRLFAYHENGAPIVGWDGLDIGVNMTGKPVITDIDPSRSGSEVILMDLLGCIRYYDQQATRLASECLMLDGGMAQYSMQPVVADVDPSPGLEIITGAGSLGYPSQMYVWDSQLGYLHHMNAGSNFRATPTVANLDPDSQAELVVGAMDTKLYAWNLDGTALPGQWPKDTNWVFHAGATIANLDGAGQPEVVAIDTDGDINVLSSYGYPLSGWPKSLPRWYDGLDAVVADIDFSSPGKEILVGDWSSTMHAFRLGGSYVPGFPITIPNQSGYALGGEVLVLQLDPATPEPELYIPAGDALLAYTSNGTPLPEWTIRQTGLVINPRVDDIDDDGLFEMISFSHGAVYVWDLPLPVHDAVWPQAHLNEMNNASFLRCAENIPENTCVEPQPSYCGPNGVVVDSCGAPGQCGCPVPDAECQTNGSCACPGGLTEGQCTNQPPLGCSGYQIVSLCSGADNVADSADDCGCPAETQYCSSGNTCRDDVASFGVEGDYYCGQDFDHLYAEDIRERRVSWPWTLTFRLIELGRYGEECDGFSGNSIRWDGWIQMPSGPVTFYGNGIHRVFFDSFDEPDLEWNGFGGDGGTVTIGPGWHSVRIEMQTSMENGISAQLGWENGNGASYAERFPSGQVTVDYLVPPSALRLAQPQGGGASPILFKEVYEAAVR